MKNRRASLFIGFVITTGAVALCAELLDWEFQQPLRLGIYLGIALFAAIMKFRLPGMTGSMSVYFVPILIGIAQLPLDQTLVIGGAATIVQMIWHAKSRPQMVRVGFSVAGVVIAIVVSDRVYRTATQFQDVIGIPVVFAMTYMTYFVMNSLPVSIVISLTEKKPLVGIWRECYVWSFPIFMLGAVIAGLYVAAHDNTRLQVCIVFVPLVYLVYRAYRVYLARLADEKTNAETTAALHLRTIEALALAIDAKDSAAADELARVQTYSVALGQIFGLDEPALKALRAAALLRDIGKLAIPQHVLAKRDLSAAEFDRIRTHPIVGAEILEWVKFPYPVAPIVRAHHEKWDGSGYPYGLAGEDIPLPARILTAVDCLNALMSDRHYRSGMPLDSAMEKIVAEAGKSFDPTVVEVLRNRCAQLEEQVQAQCNAQSAISETLKQEYEATRTADYPAPEHPARPVANSLASISSARKETQLATADVAYPRTLKEYLAMFALRIRDLIPHDAIAVYVRRADRLVPELITRDDSPLLSALELDVGEGMSGAVADTHKSILNGISTPEFARFAATPPPHMKSAVSVPIEAEDGTTGVLTLYSALRNGFTKDHLRILLSLRLKVLNAKIEDPASPLEDLAIPAEVGAEPEAFSTVAAGDGEAAQEPPAATDQRQLVTPAAQWASGWRRSG